MQIILYIHVLCEPSRQEIIITLCCSHIYILHRFVYNHLLTYSADFPLIKYNAYFQRKSRRYYPTRLAINLTSAGIGRNLWGQLRAIFEFSLSVPASCGGGAENSVVFTCPCSLKHLTYCFGLFGGGTTTGPTVTWD